MKKFLNWYFKWRGVSLTLNKAQRFYAITLGVLLIVFCINAIYCMLISEAFSVFFSLMLALICIEEISRVAANNLSNQIKELKNKDNGVEK